MLFRKFHSFANNDAHGTASSLPGISVNNLGPKFLTQGTFLSLDTALFVSSLLASDNMSAQAHKFIYK